jgi:hypothetical protein
VGGDAVGADRFVAGTLRTVDGLGLAGLRVALYRRVPHGLDAERTEPPQPDDWVAGARSGRDGRFSIPLPPAAPDGGGPRAHICVVVGTAGDDVSGGDTVLARTAWRPEPLTVDDLVLVVTDEALATSTGSPRPMLTTPRARGALAGMGIRVADGTRRTLFEATTGEVRRRVERRRRGGDLARRLLARRRAADPESGSYVRPGESATERLETVRRQGVDDSRGYRATGCACT